jgi:transcriptional antiterminator NusG
MADTKEELTDTENDEPVADETAPPAAETQPTEDEIQAVVETPAEPPVEEHGEFEQARDPNRKWYVIHTYSGYENKVQQNLIRRIDSMGMKDKIFRVLVPTEEEIEFRDGKRKTVQKKIYPGYVIVEMIMTEDSWYVVRNTSGVTGFVSPGAKPVPLPDEEVEKILRLMGEVEPVKVKIDLNPGQGVRVTHGPFQDFHGVVQEVSPEREKVKVLITIFGRETPVELDFGQVEKL